MSANRELLEYINQCIELAEKGRCKVLMSIHRAKEVAAALAERETPCEKCADLDKKLSAADRKLLTFTFQEGRTESLRQALVRAESAIIGLKKEIEKHCQYEDALVGAIPKMMQKAEAEVAEPSTQPAQLVERYIPTESGAMATGMCEPESEVGE